MTEIWLHANRRVLLLAMLPVTLLGGIGGMVFLSKEIPFPGWLGIGGLGVAGLLLLGLVRQIFQPRIAYRGECVLFYLKASGPISVPRNIVEAFFQGEGPAHLPGTSGQQTKSVNLIARLAQRETHWQRREVKSALGSWEDGYVTIRGTWSEPITGEVIRRLNERLAEVKRAELPAAGGPTQR